jgi:hypothetical protein
MPRLSRNTILLQLSLAHNLTERIIERDLTHHYPNHGKVLRVVGRVERIVGAWFHFPTPGCLQPYEMTLRP